MTDIQKMLEKLLFEGDGSLSISSNNYDREESEKSESMGFPAEAINAVRDYMIQRLLGGLDCSKDKTSGYEWDLKDGRVVELGVTVKEKEEEK